MYDELYENVYHRTYLDRYAHQNVHSPSVPIMGIYMNVYKFPCVASSQNILLDGMRLEPICLLFPWAICKFQSRIFNNCLKWENIRLEFASHFSLYPRDVYRKCRKYGKRKMLGKIYRKMRKSRLVCISLYVAVYILKFYKIHIHIYGRTPPSFF